MNGKINRNAFLAQLNQISVTVREMEATDVDFEVAAQIVSRFMEAQRTAAYANPVNVAHEILNDPDNGSYYADHKIQAIKVIRERSCCSLREAKVAFESAVIPVLHNRAKLALKALAVANRFAPAYTRRVWAHDPEFSSAVDPYA